MKGVMDFFAPEYKKNSSINDPKAFLERSDIWSFGVIFYRLLYGEMPIFDLQGQPIFPKKPANISVKSRNLISRCLEMDPHKRCHLLDLKEAFEQPEEQE